MTPRLALAAVCGVLFLTFLDNTIVSVALADMQTSLRSGVSSLQWIVDGYMLAFAGLMLTGGTLGDLFGRKKLLLGGVVVFCAGSLVGALATSSHWLIAGRVVMGVGAAACEPGTLSIIRQLYPDRRERARALGIWTAVSGISLAVGPVLGGLLVAIGGWRAIFWFNLGFGILALAAAARTLDESSDPEGRSLDVPGLVAGAAAVTAVTFAVIEGESSGFCTWWIELLFAAAAVLALAFVLIERRVADPVLRLEFFRHPAFSSATAVAFATSFGLFAVFFFTSLYLQIVAHFSGWKIALQFVAMAVAMVVAGRVAGAWTASRGPRIPMALGCLLAGGGMFVVDGLLNPHVSVAPLAGGLAIVGFGLGLALVAVTAAVLAIVPAERSGMAASTVNTSRMLGGVLAVAILGAVVNRRLVGELSRKLTDLGVPSIFQSLVINAVTHGGLPANASQAAASNPVAAANPGLLSKVLAEAEAAFGHGLHRALIVAAAILLAGAAVSWLRSRTRASRPRAEAPSSSSPAAPLAGSNCDSGERGSHAVDCFGDERRRGAEGEACEAVALTSEGRAGAEGDPAAFEEGLGRVVAKPEPATVQPRQIAGLRRHVADLGQLGFEQLPEQTPVPVELRDERAEPRPALGEGGGRGENAKMPDVVGDVLRELLRQLPLHPIRSGDDHRTLQAREVPGLRSAGEREPSLCRLAAKREERRVSRARHRHRSVDLVRNDEHAVAVCELGDSDQLVTREGQPDWVVRVAEQVRLRPGGERMLDRVEVELPAAVEGAERRLDDAPADLANDVEERRVDGRIHDHLVVRAGQRAEHLGNAGHHVGDQPDAGRVDHPVEPGRGEARERRRQADGVGIPRVVALDRFAQNSPHRRSKRKVHLGDPGGQHVRRVPRPLRTRARTEGVEREIVEEVAGGRCRHRPAALRHLR